MFNLMLNALEKENNWKQFFLKDGEWVRLTQKELIAHFVISLYL